jgi:aryl-alcohol dehydrogenase-like predicted oxidoreductase
VIEAIAYLRNVTPAQIALAWILAQKPWMAPIAGTTKLHCLEENIAAASVELSVEDFREMHAATSQMVVQGERYSEGAQRLINR